MAAVEREIVSALEGFSGQLLGPGDDGYDDARRVHNALIDKHPALIARCLGTVDANGVSTLVTRGQLNLAHRDGHDKPKPLVPGERTHASVRLDAIGRAIPAGHQLRISVSPTGWPRAWPSPETVTLTVFAGASYLELPVRHPRDGVPRKGPTHARDPGGRGCRG